MASSVVLLHVLPELFVFADFITFLASLFSLSMLLFLVTSEIVIWYVKPHFWHLWGLFSMHLYFLGSAIAIFNIYPHVWHIWGLSSMILSFVSPEIVVFNLFPQLEHFSGSPLLCWCLCCLKSTFVLTLPHFLQVGIISPWCFSL